MQNRRGETKPLLGILWQMPFEPALLVVGVQHDHEFVGREGDELVFNRLERVHIAKLGRDAHVMPFECFQNIVQAMLRFGPRLVIVAEDVVLQPIADNRRDKLDLGMCVPMAHQFGDDALAITLSDDQYQHALSTIVCAGGSRGGHANIL